MTIAVILDMTLRSLLNCYQSYEGTCIWEILSFFFCGENLQNFSGNQNELVISNCSMFSHKDAHKSETSCETSFLIGKPKWRKSPKTNGAVIIECGKVFTNVLTLSRRQNSMKCCKVYCQLDAARCRRTAPSKQYTQPTQRLSGPPPIYKLGAENHMLQLNI